MGYLQESEQETINLSGDSLSEDRRRCHRCYGKVRKFVEDNQKEVTVTEDHLDPMLTLRIRGNSIGSIELDEDEVFFKLISPHGGIRFGITDNAVDHFSDTEVVLVNTYNYMFDESLDSAA